MPFAARINNLRQRDDHDQNRVTFVELFFDLVFVFAITQLSHTLLAHLTTLGVFEVALLYMAVWVIWIDTCWCTNWLNPQRVPVRLMLFALMLAAWFCQFRSLRHSATAAWCLRGRLRPYRSAATCSCCGRCEHMRRGTTATSPKSFAGAERRPWSGSSEVWRPARSVSHSGRSLWRSTIWRGGRLLCSRARSFDRHRLECRR